MDWPWNLSIPFVGFSCSSSCIQHFSHSLSIPFVGFGGGKMVVYIFNTLIFQFPLLGSFLLGVHPPRRWKTFNSLCWVRHAPARYGMPTYINSSAFNSLCWVQELNRFGMLQSVMNFQFPLLGSPWLWKRERLPKEGILSIPFVGFLLYIAHLLLNPQCAFQFPLLGSPGQTPHILIHN